VDGGIWVGNCGLHIEIGLTQPDKKPREKNPRGRCEREGKYKESGGQRGTKMIVGDVRVVPELLTHAVSRATTKKKGVTTELGK